MARLPYYNNLTLAKRPRRIRIQKNHPEKQKTHDALARTTVLSAQARMSFYAERFPRSARPNAPIIAKKPISPINGSELAVCGNGVSVGSGVGVATGAGVG